MTHLVLSIIGIAVTALGLYLGLGSHVTRLRADCGTGFGGVDSSIAQRDAKYAAKAERDQLTRDLTNSLEGQPAEADTPISQHRLADACQPAVADRRTLALIVTVVGGAVAVAGIMLLGLAADQRREEERRPARR